MQTRETLSIGPAAQVLDVIQLGKLASVVGGYKLLKFVKRLPPQVIAVNQEEYAFARRQI